MTVAESTVESQQLTQDETRSALAAEWNEQDPITEEDIFHFYRSSEAMGPDLDAWHRSEGRQKYTTAIVYGATKFNAKTVCDLGCGAGHDLAALHAAGVTDLYGLEINDWLVERAAADGHAVIVDYPFQLPIERSDILICIDVLEHVTDPGNWLGEWASRAKMGALLYETSSCNDASTPLHLPENRGFHPGQTLEALGWKLVDKMGEHFRVWRRDALVGVERSSLLLCAYRALSIPTHHAVEELANRGWREMSKFGDALISRSRSAIVSQWYRETNDDAFLMIDDDITFAPDAAERMISRIRSGVDVVCGAYPVRNGAHLALRPKPGKHLQFADADTLAANGFTELVECIYAATGFMAVSRRAIKALVDSLPLVHGDQQWAFWPLFLPLVTEPNERGVQEYLSEDYAFCHRLRALGFTIYLDQTIPLGHLGHVEISVRNMDAISKALGVNGSS